MKNTTDWRVDAESRIQVCKHLLPKASGKTEREAPNEVLIAIELWLETAEKGGARGSSAPGKSPPRRAGREQDGGRLRI